MKTYILKQTGETVQGFTIDGIIGYHAGEPVYSTTCLDCGSSGVAIKHDEFRKGKQRCSSSTHFAAEKSKLRVLSLPPEPEPETQPNSDYVANLKASRDRAETKRKQQAAKEWVQYIQHGIQHGWDLDKMVDIGDWLKALPEHREEILEKQRAGHYDQKKENSVKEL